MKFADFIMHLLLVVIPMAFLIGMFFLWNSEGKHTGHLDAIAVCQDVALDAAKNGDLQKAQAAIEIKEAIEEL